MPSPILQPSHVMNRAREFFRRPIQHLTLVGLATLAGPAWAQAVDASRPRVGLVLGGGGARGAAHIGVLEVLASRLGLTRERVRQIQQEALAKLRRRMARKGVDRDSLF